MVFYRKFAKILLGCSMLFASTAWLQKAPIPALPPVERPEPASDAEKDASSLILTNQDPEVNPSFNADALTGGFPRYFNALDITGYFRTRLSYYRNAHLKTYVPGKGGTSNSLAEFKRL